MHRGFGWGSLREREYLEDPGLDVKIILKWVFRKYNGGLDCIDLAQDRGEVAGFCGHCNEPLGFNKSREIS